MSAFPLRPSALATEILASSFSFRDWPLSSAISLLSIWSLAFWSAFPLRSRSALEFWSAWRWASLSLTVFSSSLFWALALEWVMASD
ncbi:MAG TPA: hypothetical protein VE758_00205 [Chthoniobacterales bacterium]|nr:hypothetical protein [Chthoniobacterales bacterium]